MNITIKIKSLVILLVIAIIIFIIITLLILDPDYRQDFLKGFVYPISVIGVASLFGYIFFEKFKKELDLILFKNTKIFEKQILIIDEFYDVINEIIEELEYWMGKDVNLENEDDYHTLEELLKKSERIRSFIIKNSYYLPKEISQNLNEFIMRIYHLSRHITKMTETLISARKEFPGFFTTKTYTFKSNDSEKLLSEAIEIKKIVEEHFYKLLNHK